jgi:predicted nucleotidyltransferase
MKLAGRNEVLVFTSQQREQIRAELVAAAKADSRIAGAAHLGSAALGSEDRWSDIDLGLCLANDAQLDQVLIDWTARLYRDHAAVANYDLRRGDILYRVFLLDNTLQIDLSFWPADELRAVGPKFSLIFGVASEPVSAPVPDSNDLIGMAWLYALHVRSSIARSRVLQAEHMLSGMRDNVLPLMCKRHGVAALQGRGLDDLPEKQKVLAAESLARSLEPAELNRTFRVTTGVLLEELRCTDSDLAAKLKGPLNTIVNSLTPSV